MSKFDNDQKTTDFAIYVLSRGKGVPESAREFLKKSIDMINDLKEKGHVITTTITRIGLEGETRYCMKFADSDLANNTFQQMQSLSEGIELVNVVKESCDAESEVK